MSRYRFPPRAAQGAMPVPVAVYEPEAARAYGSRGSRPASAARGRQDSGLIRVYDDPGESVWSINVGALGDNRPVASPHGRQASSLFGRPSPVETDPYDDWDLDEEEARKVLRRIATPGAWAAVAIIVLVVLAFVFVTPVFAGASAGISRYSDLSGAGIVAALAPEPVIDAGSGAQQVEPAPAAQTAPHDGGYSVIGAPSTSVNQIEAVLQKYGSPAAGLGQKLYDLGVQYGIDPAYALAFFVHESSCGTQGVARFTRSLGNIRWTPGWDSYSGYRKYPSWEAGMEDWYKLITDLYINQWGLRTVDAIVPVYAPVEDNNSPSSYIASVKWMVDDWRGK
ncbi:MAG: glucosaminidase domain-containing protein [Chloroflexia bacterium]